MCVCACLSFCAPSSVNNRNSCIHVYGAITDSVVCYFRPFFPHHQACGGVEDKPIAHDARHGEFFYITMNRHHPPPFITGIHVYSHELLIVGHSTDYVFPHLRTNLATIAPTFLFPAAHIRPRISSACAGYQRSCEEQRRECATRPLSRLDVDVDPARVIRRERKDCDDCHTLTRFRQLR